VKLSIVIVNYNVQYFLEQCLLSVQRAMQGLEVEVFVVDNASVDGSMGMVKEKFPWLTRIQNAENVGFSRANNQAMRISRGEYILLLNPDTVIEEDTLRKVTSFMDAHPEAGGLGVKMVDGKGRFLPESKRGLPTPATSFYKIFGISKLFPTSARFNNYHLGHLDPAKTHAIDILSGAFMCMRKAALDQVGLLDEAFFMYGEDIDLSWRIRQGGWKNYYFPDTTIIHYKGESTKKGSLNYVFVFYKAMVIFANKHFSAKNARLFSMLIHMAIWLRAGMALAYRFLQTIALPLADAAFTIIGWWWLKEVYAQWQQKVYEDYLVWSVFLATTVIYLFSVWLNGGYDKPLSAKRSVRPIFTAAVAIVVLYSLLPETMRFSRALILGGGIIALVVFYTNRMFVRWWKTGSWKLADQSMLRFGIVGYAEEAERVKLILQAAHYQPDMITVVSPHLQGSPSASEHSLNLLPEIVRVHGLDQVIFCAKDVASSDIIAAMSSMAGASVEFKIAPPESLFIIGSNSIETSGDVYILDVNSIVKTVNRRKKRVLDVILSIVFLALAPILLWVQKSPIGFLQNCLSVLRRQKTWVGFAPTPANRGLPALPPGVVYPGIGQSLSQEHLSKYNVLYAKDYSTTTDLRSMLKGWRLLGNRD
jgi:O-antigen biosynthesis protein